jgi:hypothetical protein
MQTILLALLWKATLGRRGPLRGIDAIVAFIAVKQSLFIGSAATVIVSHVSLLLIAAASNLTARTSP